MVNKRYYLGIDNGDSHENDKVFFVDLDGQILSGESFAKLTNYFNPIEDNLIVYKTLNGYHIISLNFYNNNQLEHLYMDFLKMGLIDLDFLTYVIKNNFRATIRINKKPNEERKLLYWCIGKKPIHKQYFEIYNAMFFNGKQKPDEKILKSSVSVFIGYVWDLDLSKKWTFEKILRGNKNDRTENIRGINRKNRI